MSATAVPALDYVIEGLPEAEAVLAAVGLPQLAVFGAALQATLKLVQAAVEGKGFDATAALEAADATALAELAARFKKP